MWTEWFPSTGYRYVNGPVMEVYLDPDPRSSRLEMWLMIELHVKSTNIGQREEDRKDRTRYTNIMKSRRN
ncbi:MAG: hypothetical protein ACLTDX_05490 [[Clostridium] innocuum]